MTHIFTVILSDANVYRASNHNWSAHVEAHGAIANLADGYAITPALSATTIN